MGIIEINSKIKFFINFFNIIIITNLLINYYCMVFNLKEYYDYLNIEKVTSDLEDVNKNNIITLWELRKMHEDSSARLFCNWWYAFRENLDDDIELISWEILSPIDQKYKIIIYLLRI